MRSLGPCFAFLAFLTFQFSVAFAQSATPTGNILNRMTIVQSQYGRASIFSIDVDQREYWITAKHVLTGMEYPPYGTLKPTVAVRILNPGAPGEQWLPMVFGVLEPWRRH